MSRAQRVNRVFNTDNETCSVCGGAVKVIACIENPVVVEKILTHLNSKNAPQETGLFSEERAPPAGLFRLTLSSFSLRCYHPQRTAGDRSA